MTDRTDASEPALSSEDLIRQARMPYEAPASDAPSSGAALEPSDYSARPTPEPAIDGYEATPDRVARPADRIATEPIQAAPWDGGPLQATEPSLLQRYGKFMLFGAIGLGVIVFGMLDKTKNVEDLSVGDCLLMPEIEEISSVESTDCASEHELEVFALVTVPDGKDAPYPGEEALGDRIFEECLSRFQPYVGTSYEESIWFANPMYPTRESWEDSNDREGSCVLLQIGADNEALTVTGSARGSGR